MGGLRNFILNAERISFFEKNREGICSIAGYFSIFCLAAFTSRCLMYSQANKRQSRLLAFTAVYSLIYYKIYTDFELPSRRMANLSYVAWMMSCCSYFWWLLAFLNDACGFPHSGVPKVLEAINRQGF